MPRIELIDVPLYTPNDPYHWQYDNLPLKNLMRRQNLINLALDDLIVQARDAIGTQGSFANRLNQSLNPDGTLKSEAIDSALHFVGQHTDDEWGSLEEYVNWLTTREAPFVRMMKSEADKLANIASGATNFKVSIQRDDEGEDIVELDSGVLKIEPSSSVTWELQAPNKLTAHLGFPVESAHRHYYDQTPASIDTESDFKNYKVNSAATAFVEGSLRVHVNGMRLSAGSSIYVPGALVDDPWTLLSYTSDAEAGTFTLSAAINEEDIIKIDYDILYVS